MKGLIRNNFYAMEGNMGISFIVAAFLAIMPVFLKNSSFIPIILAIQIFIFVVNTGTSLHADTTAKWNKYERILPVKSSEPILAKYISFVILILLGVAMSLLTLFCAAAAGIILNLADLAAGYGYGLTLSSISIGIMYPVMLKTGTDKNELIRIRICGDPAWDSLCPVSLDRRNESTASPGKYSISFGCIGDFCRFLLCFPGDISA